jgi:hypothetical protein
MKKIIFSLFLVFSFLLFSCENLQSLIPAELNTSGLSNEEIIRGLKEALKVGTDTSVTKLHKTNGYLADQAVKILLPQEAQIITQHVSVLPGGQLLVDEVVKKINRAAEDAAAEAKPIFINAITSITITDGLSILNGANNAATNYLKQKTYTSLQSAFQPKIYSSLNKEIIGGISAESAYRELISKYNLAVTAANLTGKNYPKVTTNSLSEYTTQRALDGLFLKVAEEESDIRQKASARVTDILKKVFGRNG